MHPAHLTPKLHKQPARPTKTEVRAGNIAGETKAKDRATSSDEEAVLLGFVPANESEFAKTGKRAVRGK